jgi:hypothetical protein
VQCWGVPADKVTVNITNYLSDTPCVFTLWSNGEMYPYIGKASVPAGKWGTVSYTRPAPGNDTTGVGYVLYPGGKPAECSFQFTL